MKKDEFWSKLSSIQLYIASVLLNLTMFVSSSEPSSSSVVNGNTGALSSCFPAAVVFDRLDYQEPCNYSDFAFYDAEGPLVQCNFLPDEFVECFPPFDLKGNATLKEELGCGCTKFGGSRFDEVERTNVVCRVLPCIECHGERTFLRENYPCIKYSRHYFLSVLLYSIFLGFLGIDRFCLGHTGVAVGKLLTLGGFGIWWLVDVILLVTGHLTPEDQSSWLPYY